MTARYAAIALTAVTSAVVALFVVLIGWGPDPGTSPPQALKPAAVQQYEERAGVRGVTVEYAQDWGDCAVVDLIVPPGSGRHSVFMLVDHGVWRIAQTSDDPGADFGDTDEIYSESDCRASIGVYDTE